MPEPTALEAASTAAAAPAAAAPPPRPAAGAIRGRLLIADDNKVNRLLLARTLEVQGHQITIVDSGTEALQRLRSERYDLLLVDLEMPGLDGFAVLEQITLDPALRDVPVIVASSVESVAQIARCIELGAEDFLHKPVNPVLLNARVGSCLDKKRLRDQQKALVERNATAASGIAAAQGGGMPPGQRLPATVLSVRLRDFTARAESEPPADTIELLNVWYTLMIDAIGAQRGAVNRMSGDAMLAVFGAPTPSADPGDAPLGAVRAALDMVEMLEILNADRTAAGKAPVAIGVGIVTGDVIAGTTGMRERAAYTCVGATVDAAAALEAMATSGPRPILIDEATRAAVAGRVATDPHTGVQAQGHSSPVHAVRTA